jgi:EXS family
MDWNLLERRNDRWQLRQRRAYRSTAFYWTTCGVNILLRFCWTLTFLPVRYLDAAGNLRQSLGNDGYMNVVLGPVVASAEIVRRSLWGLIRLEWEAVKNKAYDDPDGDEALEQSRRGEPALELTPMKLSDGDFESNTLFVGTRARKPSRFSVFGKDISEMTQGQILSELGVYSTIFFVLGALAAAHRETQ